MMRKLFFFVAYIIYLSSISVSANLKHPRALILEKQITQDIEKQLKNLLSNEPFLVSVYVDPFITSQDSQRTQLPFLGSVEDHQVELWNDPDVPHYLLLNRVNRISANVIVDQSLPDHLIDYIKNLVKSQWPFVEGRDFVTIEKRNLIVSNVSHEEDVFKYIKNFGWWLLGAFLIYTLIQFFSSYISSQKVASAIKNIKIEGNNLAEGGAKSWNLGSLGGNKSQDNFSSSSLRGDTRISGGELQLHDTIKISELITQWVQDLKNEKNFPTLEDMKMLEEELLLNPSSVGALINSFPEELKNLVFSYSKSEKWFEALLFPSLLDAKSFSLMNRLMKINRKIRSLDEEKLILTAWYSEEKLIDFLKNIETDDALWILSYLPKNLALSLGREILPGRWAILLDYEKLSSLSRKPNLEKIKNYLEQLNHLKPLRSIHLLSMFKQEADLIKYLNSAHPQVEKEIYLASGERGGIHILRPPFYLLFETQPELLKDFLKKVSLETLSLAVFNLSKDYRQIIEKSLNDKQKFLLLDYLRRWDKKGIHVDQIGQARSEVGKALYDFLKQQKEPVDLTSDVLNTENKINRNVA